MNWLKKYAPTLMAIGSTLLTAFTPEIQKSIASHPTVTLVLTSVLTIISHFLPSPISKQ